jgi:S-adenosylhomocysteine hydrolase
VEHLTLHGAELENRVLDVPKEIDEEIARLKLSRSAWRSTRSPPSSANT